MFPLGPLPTIIVQLGSSSLIPFRTQHRVPVCEGRAWEYSCGLCGEWCLQIIGGISMYQNGYQGNQGDNFWQQAPFQPPLENREIIELLKLIQSGEIARAKLGLDQ